MSCFLRSKIREVELKRSVHAVLARLKSVRSNIARPIWMALRYSSNNVLGPLSEERYIVDSQRL